MHDFLSSTISIIRFIDREYLFYILGIIFSLLINAGQTKRVVIFFKKIGTLFA